MRLELRDVSCGYDKGRPVLSRVRFSVETGDICCLLGPNGIGKTTLFKTILGLLKPLGGEITIDGESILSWSAKKMARHVAYVSQFHNPPFPYRVRDVVLMGRVSHTGYFGRVSELDYRVAGKAMSDMGITHYSDSVYTDLSGGERQLVMIARALAQEPQWLVMDEPTANLDYGNIVKVVKKIRELRDGGYGVILTTHSPDQAFMYDSNVALLRRGEALIHGAAADVITESYMREAYGIEVKIIEFFDTGGRLVRMCSPKV